MVSRLFLILFFFFSLNSEGAGGDKLYVQVGPSFIMSSSTTPGIAASFLKKISSGNAYMGIDSGLYFASGASSALVIPIIPYIVYYFAARDFFKPWLGFGFGVNLNFGGTAGSPAVVVFKPGVHFAIAKEVEGFAEGRFGIIGSTFAFIPTFGAMFPF